MTEEQRRVARLETYRRYNMSKKGRKRYKTYEDAHPERQTRWAPIMLLRARQGRVLCRSFAK